jgi:RNA polymerase sigma-70 factor (ECF subfamily)
MFLRNFILFSDIHSFQIALGIVPPMEGQGGQESPLLPLVANGDAQAMKRCIDQYSPLVWSIVNRRIHVQRDAEEACQEIFTEVWQNASKFNPSLSKESTFIGLIARRRSIDWLRKQNRLPPLSSLDHLDNHPSSPSLAGNSIDRGKLWELISALPSKTLELFSLHFEKGMTHEEISGQTGIPLGTVKTQLRRGLIEARKLLKDFLAETDQGVVA